MLILWDLLNKTVAEGDASNPHNFGEELKKEEARKDFAAIRNFYEMIWKLCNIPLYDLQRGRGWIILE